MSSYFPHKFRNNILHGRGLLTGDIIEIADGCITLKRARLFTNDHYSITIPLCNISTIKVLKTSTGAAINVVSRSSQEFLSKGYSYTTACKIKDLIQEANITQG